MIRKIGLAFAAAAIGFTLVALAEASIGPGTHKPHLVPNGMTLSGLQPAW